MAVYGGGIPANFTAAYTPAVGNLLELNFATELTQRVFSLGEDVSQCGVAAVANAAQGVFAQGVSAPTLPAPQIELKTRYVTTYSWADSRAGEPRTTNAQRFYLNGFEATRFSTPKVVISFYREPAGTAIPFNFKAPYTPVYGTGVAAEFSRTASFWQLSVAGIPAGELGTPTIEGELLSIAHPAGIPSNIEFGATTIDLRTRNIVCGGIPSNLLFGTSVVIWPQFVTKAGAFNANVFGSGTTATHYRRYLDTDGLNHAVFGTLWASHSPRYIEPVGITNIAVPNPVMGYWRGMFPVGLDATYFGTANIHDTTQNLYAVGLNQALFGTLTADTWLKYVEVSGFQTVLNDVRVGTPVPYNLKQYVEQVWSVDDLYSGGWFGEQEIVNRNRHLFPFGQVLTRPGYPDVYNNARLLEPLGIITQDPPLLYKAGYVTHWLQPSRPEPIEAPAITSWHIVYNDARVLRPEGYVATLFGDVLSEDRSIYRAGNWNSAEFGTAFAAPRIRTVEQRWPLDPPMMANPVVRQWRNYIEPLGIVDGGCGVPALNHHRNLITPRWTQQRDAFGVTTLRNNTPELGAYGWRSEEFGDTEIRTQWRTVTTLGGVMSTVGYLKIADRRQWIENVTIPIAGFGDTVCYRIGLDPPSNRKILPPSIFVDEFTDAHQRVPIKVPAPRVWQMIIYVTTPDPFTKFGTAVVTSNVIDLVFNSIYTIGAQENFKGPTIQLGRRYLLPEGCLKVDGEVRAYGKPRVTPHTIYAVKEATEQAKINHPVDPKVLHYIDHNQQTGASLKGLGTPTISLNNRIIECLNVVDRDTGFSSNDHLRMGSQNIDLSRRYLEVKGFTTMRFGGANAYGGVYNISMDGIEPPQVARQRVDHVVVRSPYLTPSGVLSNVFGSTDIQLLHRKLFTTGFYSERFGTSVSGDKIYMPQHLKAGFRNDPAMQGFDSSQFGVTWVTHRVRDVGAEGFDGFITGYEPGFFDERMRVTRTKLPVVQPDELVQINSLAHDTFGWPEIGTPRQVILPDGNAETFRQGGYQ